MIARGLQGLTEVGTWSQRVSTTIFFKISKEDPVKRAKARAFVPYNVWFQLLVLWGGKFMHEAGLRGSLSYE